MFADTGRLQRTLNRPYPRQRCELFADTGRLQLDQGNICRALSCELFADTGRLQLISDAIKQATVVSCLQIPVDYSIDSLGNAFFVL